MSRIPTWKWVLTLGIVGLAVAFLIVPRSGSGDSFPTLNVNLGLDLQGGIHMVMQVRTDDALKIEMDAEEARLRQALRDENITFLRIERPQLTQLQAMGIPEESRALARSTMRQQLPSWNFSDGPDGSLLAQMDTVREKRIRSEAVDDVLSGIRERVDEFGVSEPNVQRVGKSDSYRILVQLPGLENPERVKGLLTDPAFLEWKLLVYPPGQQQAFGGAASREQLLSLFGGTLPDGAGIYVENREEGGVVTPYYWPLQSASVITGNDLENASRGSNEFGEVVVTFRLDPAAGQRFGKLTRENIGRQMAILLDREVLTAPRIDSEIPSGMGIITGSFTAQEADDLAFKLRSGALRAGLDILEERNVGPSLGADSIRKGWSAGVLGLGLLLLFMLLWYRLAGVNAIIVLLLNLVLVLGVMAVFRATLTLPGIAGYILTVGMAVDANVLIFERIREELRFGKTVRSAVDGGFNKVVWTILDSNLTTLFAAIALFTYGTGPIKGFAITLSVGLVANMFTAVFVSRMLFQVYLGNQPRVQRLSI
ncbi:MAG: protein translocase subunit SecD [Acidobacteria bacterium]|nr:MAG: protein translocase subunit SecD [Acidobacteriota bacterium]